MIHVIASIRVKDERLNAFLAIFTANVPHVRAEKGCIEYVPAVDVQTDISAQQRDACLVTVIEKWEDVEALKAHLTAPHMLSYKEAVKDLVENVEVRILREA